MADAWNDLLGLYQRIMVLGEGLQECFASDRLEAARPVLAERDRLVAAAAGLLTQVLPGAETPAARERRDAVFRMAAAAAEQNRRILFQAEEMRDVTARALAGLQDRRTSVGAYADAVARRHQTRGGHLDRLH